MSIETVEVAGEIRADPDIRTGGAAYSATQKVAKNAFWLIAQPLALNVLSIFATAYIARLLGKGDYGLFVFVTTFVTLFLPIANLGLRAITIREIAEKKSRTRIILGKILTLRLVLAALAIGAVFAVLNIMHYPAATRTLVYLFSVTILFNATCGAFVDAFQGHEKMEYVAWAQLISGFVLTLLSVAILYVGYRLTGLVAVYVFGSFLTMAITVWYAVKNLGIPRLGIDIGSWKQSLYKGAPFFYPAMFAAIGAKIGIVMLSTMAGNISVGIYGAAVMLVDRLTIIPDGVSTAIFPALAKVYKGSPAEAVKLYERFMSYLFMLGTPIAVGMTILAKPIIHLIYGSEYGASVVILRLLAWWLLMTFLISLQGWTLGAIRQEKRWASTVFALTPLQIVLTYVMVLKFKIIGLAISNIVIVIAYFIVYKTILDRCFTKSLIHTRTFIKVALATMAMALVAYALREVNLFVAIGSAFAVYAAAIVGLRTVSIDEIVNLKSLLLRPK